MSRFWFAKNARIYCGSYALVESPRGELFRCEGPIPEGYTYVPNSTDAEGLLLPQFWTLPRIINGALHV